jgi:hypothetical protein
MVLMFRRARITRPLSRLSLLLSAALLACGGQAAVAPITPPPIIPPVPPGIVRIDSTAALAAVTALDAVFSQPGITALVAEGADDLTGQAASLPRRLDPMVMGQTYIRMEDFEGPVPDGSRATPTDIVRFALYAPGTLTEIGTIDVRDISGVLDSTETYLDVTVLINNYGVLSYREHVQDSPLARTDTTQGTLYPAAGGVALTFVLVRIDSAGESPRRIVRGTYAQTRAGLSGTLNTISVGRIAPDSTQIGITVGAQQTVLRASSDMDSAGGYAEGAAHILQIGTTPIYSLILGQAGSPSIRRLDGGPLGAGEQAGVIAITDIAGRLDRTTAIVGAVNRWLARIAPE